MSQHRSQQEWPRLVQKYYNSEQSAAQSCLEHNLHPKTLTVYKMRIASQSAWETKRHPANTRYALVSIFLHLRRAEIIDGLIKLLIQIIHKLTVRADNKVKKPC